MDKAKKLKNKIIDILEKQGYAVSSDGSFKLIEDDRESKRQAHVLAKAERIALREDYILKKFDQMKEYMIKGKELNVEKIDPVLREVKPSSKEEDIFRWWNLIWWSLPYERAYGRQMRFIVWDKYHNAPIGLIGLQSPILSWSARDQYLGIKQENRDFWVNQSLSAQRIGSLPPYNEVLGGKLVTLLMTANTVRNSFHNKYENKKTVMKERTLPARLLFITTTGAYGKSSVYQRLRFKGEVVSKFIGYTQGTGTFHVPDALYKKLLSFLKDKEVNVRRGYGSGPSRKMRLIDMAFQELGFKNGVLHGIKRAVYLFPLAANLKEVVSDHQAPIWVDRNEEELADYWKKRWILPRLKERNSFRNFTPQDFIEDIRYNLDEYKKIHDTATHIRL